MKFLFIIALIREKSKNELCISVKSTNERLWIIKLRLEVADIGESVRKRYDLVKVIRNGMRRHCTISIKIIALYRSKIAGLRRNFYLGKNLQLISKCNSVWHYWQTNVFTLCAKDLRVIDADLTVMSVDNQTLYKKKSATFVHWFLGKKNMKLRKHDFSGQAFFC